MSYLKSEVRMMLCSDSMSCAARPVKALENQTHTHIYRYTGPAFSIDDKSSQTSLSVTNTLDQVVGWQTNPTQPTYTTKLSVIL